MGHGPAARSQPRRARAVRSFLVAASVFTVTVGLLAAGATSPGLPQFSDEAFTGRLMLYPVMMTVAPLAWSLATRRHASAPPTLPWSAFSWMMAAFLVDVAGNTFNLYDRFRWWDDANHFTNWFLISTGIALLVTKATLSPRWLAGVLVTGAGAIMALLWELGEWFQLDRSGIDLVEAFEDTLTDQSLGTLGSACAAVAVAVWSRTSAEAASDSNQDTTSRGRQGASLDV